MSHPLRLRPDIIPPLIPRPVPRVFAVRHAKQSELLVRAHATHQSVVQPPHHGEGLAPRHVNFVDRDLDDCAVSGGGENVGVGSEVFPGGGLGGQGERRWEGRDGPFVAHLGG